MIFQKFRVYFHHGCVKNENFDKKGGWTKMNLVFKKVLKTSIGIDFSDFPIIYTPFWLI